MSIEKDIGMLIYQIMRITRKRVKHPQLPDEPSVVQLQALHFIHEGYSTMGVLADEMQVQMPTATSLIDRLVKAKFVHREHDPDDRRIVRLSLTPKGKLTLKKTLSSKMARMKFLMNSMPAADQTALQKILQNLLHNLENEK